MSSASSEASQQALEMNKRLSQGYYDIAIPGLRDRMGSINTSLKGGEPDYLKTAYQEQRTGLTEGLAAKGGTAQANLSRANKGAVSGGNIGASLSTADIGSQLANALYGSKFQEGQANIDQSFNMMNMALGGANTSGNAALTASGNELGAISHLPNYNPTAANIFGAAAGGSSLYGALNQAGVFGGGAPSLAPAGSVGVGLGSSGGAGVGLGGG